MSVVKRVLGTTVYKTEGDRSRLPAGPSQRGPLPLAKHRRSSPLVAPLMKDYIPGGGGGEIGKGWSRRALEDGFGKTRVTQLRHSLIDQPTQQHRYGRWQPLPNVSFLTLLILLYRVRVPSSNITSSSGRGVLDTLRGGAAALNE